MTDIFKKAMEANDEVMKTAGKLDIISIEVNATMKAYLNAENPSPKFLANRYLELVNDLARFGLINKEWGEEK